MHIHAQTIADKNTMWFRPLRGEDQHAAITTSITTLIATSITTSIIPSSLLGAIGMYEHARVELAQTSTVTHRQRTRIAQYKDCSYRITETFVFLQYIVVAIEHPKSLQFAMLQYKSSPRSSFPMIVVLVLFANEKYSQEIFSASMPYRWQSCAS